MDFNVSNDYVDSYVEIFSSLGFENLIDIPTRVADFSSTIIDHLMYRHNKPLNCHVFVVESQI